MSDRPPGSGRGTPSGSQVGSKPGSKAGSQAGSSKHSSPSKGSDKGTEAQKATGTGLDPALERKPLTDAEVLGKRCDLPPDAYLGASETKWTKRPGVCTSGKAIKMGLNIFPVVTYGDMDIYQYDIIVQPNLKNSHSLVKKVWNAQTVTKALQKIGGRWLYDGSKLAWSSIEAPQSETRITVNLDALKKEEHELVKKKVDKQHIFLLTIRQTKKIHLAYLKNYLSGRISWDTHVLECMNFFDHCLRQWPSERWMLIKRNFFDPDFPFSMLAFDVLASQGIYCAPRLSEAFNRGGSGLAINVDRCQTAFWPAGTLLETACCIINSQKLEWKNLNEHKVESLLRPRDVKDEATGKWQILPSEAFVFLRRLTKLKFTVSHRGKVGEPRVYTVKRVMFDTKYGVDGANAKNVTFTKEFDDGHTEETTIEKHYKDRWNFILRWPRFPIVETPQGHKFPMELCNLVYHQRYNYKLNPQQTSEMIKRAATRPPRRRDDIMEGIKRIEWPNDANLKAFGIKIDPNMVITDARLLQNPEVAFANQKINPGVTGRWDLRGKKFLEPNAFALNSWSFVCIGDDAYSPKQNELEVFARNFSQTYRNHGGRVEKAAFCLTIPFSGGNMSKMCETAYYQTGNHFKAKPQIIFFVLQTKNQLTYERLKKNMECRWCIVSQVLLADHVKKANAQYMSNVAMKVNSKLGGVTCRVPGPTALPPFFPGPTMMIGVDVSHAAPGSQQPSMAALTMSMDTHATRFAAACQTNGWRKETVLPSTMHNMMPKLVKHWMSINKSRPRQVYYLRDGVSEGQFQDVMDTEVKEMKRIFRDLGCPQEKLPKFTVIIATKRHHVRFFPKANDKTAQDRNGNPLPGTLVERDVTHPHHWDWYLCSHVAIQGTARPVHYQVILDEANVKPNDLMKMLYQQCYQYCRSTTPVSLHPAVYYAHLASNRARSHEGIPAESQVMAYGKPGFPYAQNHSDVYKGANQPDVECPKLLPMDSSNQTRDMVRFLNTTMWYV